MRTEGEIAGDTAIACVQASHSAWMERGIALIRTFPMCEEATGEDIRMWLGERGLTEPDHHNAWGGLIRWAISQELIEATGKYLPMKAEKSHGRKTPVYIRTLTA